MALRSFDRPPGRGARDGAHLKLVRADVFDAEKRSDIMRAVKSNDTGPEMIVRRAAHALGTGHRLGGWGLPGKPDLVFPGRKRVVFVHGCFWHGHDCKRGARAPKDNAAYWCSKIGRNRTRDASNLRALAGMGWEALVLWECELKEELGFKARLEAFLNGGPGSSPEAELPSSPRIYDDTASYRGRGR
jgi:DNA mismatch endonuclease (patch repair protein)